MLDALGPYLLEDLPENDLLEDPEELAGATSVKGYPTSFAGMFRQQPRRRPERRERRDPADPAGLRPRTRGSARQRHSQHLPRGSAPRTNRTTGRSVSTSSTARSNDGRFEPLDGQQRLTTLFLLHWYLAFRTRPPRRPAAMDRVHVRHAPQRAAVLRADRRAPAARDLSGPPSRWITDQSWYLHLWRFDPTIQAMLVMLDAIAERFAGRRPRRDLWSA